MSNLIKSGRVVESEVPVNVGISYEFDSLEKTIVEKKLPVKNAAIKRQSENNVKEVSSPTNNEPISSTITKEEVIEQYIAEARKKAEEEYKKEIKKAYDEGIKSAEEDAKAIIEKAKIDYETIVNEVAQLKENAVLEYKEEMKGIEKEILDLALHIAEKIINYEINKSDEYVLGIVKDALDKVLNKKDVVLKLSTSDYYTVIANKKLLMANVKGFGEIEIVQDESMEPGTCIVDTPLGVIDGSLQVRMDNIQKEVQKILAE